MLIIILFCNAPLARFWSRNVYISTNNNIHTYFYILLGENKAKIVVSF